ncbi:MAG: cytochrome b/b6 domain-containing protein [Mariprofundaceae bacterium]|nr:cytochrome b/b6 domain-containing protein [Mariprofundaceae bacterium]
MSSHVVDADLKGFFDNIPPDELMQQLEQHISDGKLLELLQLFLQQDVMDGITSWKPTMGTPQGAVLSPLLANIYLHPLDQHIKSQGMIMVRHADDFVILCRSETEASHALEEVRAWVDNHGFLLSFIVEYFAILQILRHQRIDSMLFRNTSKAYGFVSIFIHWFMVITIIGMFALGLYMVDLSYVDVWYKSAPHIHQSIGLLLLFLLMFRFTWRISQPLPVILGIGIEKIIALLVHRMHYVFMFLLMISGYLISTADGRGIELFTWFEVPAVLPSEKGREDLAGLIHQILAWAFMGFVLLHASAAFKHHFIDKDQTLRRMIGLK